MSSRSLSTSKLGVQKAKQALTGKRLTQRSLVGELGYAWATISKFFNGKPVDRLIFIEICQYLDLNWQDVIDNDGIATEDTAPLLTELLTSVQTQASAARAVLTPRILQRIPRQVVAERYRPAISRGVTGNLERVIPLIAPAGYGKSTILGQLYDELQETDAGWIGLILCSDLNVTQAALLTILGQAFAAINRPITELAAELNQTHGRGILLMDTLDLIISPVFVNDFIPVLRSLIAQGTTVVFTCRDHEYGEFLNREKLISFAERVDHHRVPEFDEQEIRQAAAVFLTQQEGQPQGEAFAENILNLSADSRPLRQIIQNPLLLALLCELFAREGHVPSDLTVSKLYQRYWSEKVAYSRSESSTTSAKALEKERLCLAIAKSLFQISTQMLTESIYWDDLEIPLTETVSAAYADLLSEGVLYVHSNKIHFFHQTLLEYAIAYWLTRRSAHLLRQPWLTLLKSTEATRTQTFWYPVLRQHLTLVEETEFEQLVDDLGTSNLGTFGAIAFAAASRDQPQALQKLLPIALELSDSYQKRLRQALESVSRHLLYAIWSMLMTFLEQSRHATAINTAKTLSLLFSRWWVTLSDRLPMALDAIARRSATAHQGKDDRTQLVGWLLQECFAGMEQTLNPQLLAAFQQHYFLLGHRTACQVIRLYQTDPVPSAFQIDLLEVMMQRELPNFTELEDATIAFLVTILLQTDADHPLYAPFNFLYAKFPKRWATAQAKAIGRLAAQQPELIQPLLKTLLINPEESGEQLRQGFTAIAESIVAGADDEIADFLTQLQLDNLSKSSLSAIARFLRLCAPDFSPHNQEQLTCWLQPYLTDYLDDVIPIMNALSEISLTARELVHSNFERLPEAKQFHYRIKLLQFQPLEDHPKLSNLDKESQLLLIPYYRSLNHPDIPKILFQACQSHFKEVALAASWEIEIWGRDFVEAPHALVFLRSRFPGLQERGLTLLLHWLQQEQPISDETITEVCSALAQMENPAIACLFYESISIWVQRFKRVPPGVVETVERSLFEMIHKNRFDGGPARVAILVLKAIAQTEVPCLDAEQLYQLVKSVLTSVSLIKIPNSEPEVINLISAIVRLRGELLRRTVEEMGPVLVSQQWWRNLSAIIRTIRRIEGKQSSLLDEILQSEWCVQEIESLILEVRDI